MHAPLLATLVLDLLGNNMPDARVLRFGFRAVRPTFDNAAFSVCGERGSSDKSVHLRVRHAQGALALDATATLA